MNQGAVVLIFSLVTVQVFCQIERLDEGDSCRNRDGSEGECRLLKGCGVSKESIRQKRPKVCSFIYDEPVICCPITTSAPTIPQPQPQPQPVPLGPVGGSNSQDISFNNAAAIANQKCAEYGKSVIVQIPSPVIDGQIENIDQCGRREQALILGGEKAKEKEFPHMALIGYGDNEISWLCGGSLISERFVLSAAHCTFTKRGTATWVKLGEYDTSSDYDSDPIVIKIIQVLNHPQYNQNRNLYNDIALYKLEQLVKFNAYIRPICLPTSDHSHLKTSIASGWGHTQWGGLGSEVLLKVKLNLVDNRSCNDKFRDSRGRQLPRGIIDSQLCAGDVKGKDTCQGDSGGPLQSPIDNPYCMYQILGVTSFGKGCGLGYPGVYTNVISYLPWIVQIVWPR